MRIMSSNRQSVTVQYLLENKARFPELLDLIKLFPEKDNLSLSEITSFFQSRIIKPDKMQAQLLLLQNRKP